MRETQVRTLAFIACAFIVTALAFLGASVASFRVTSDIDKQTSSLLTNALPSVQELTRARTALRQLHESANESVLAAPPRDWRELDACWTELDAALTREMATPWYGGEHELYDGQVRPAVDELRFALDDFEGQANAPEGDSGLRRAYGRLRNALGRADTALVNLSDLNHEQAFAAAAQIVHNREAAARASLYLDVGATIVAALAAALAIGFTRRFAVVMRRNVELESERANQLDFFAQRVAHDLMSPLATVSLSLDGMLRRNDDEHTRRLAERALRTLRRSRRMVDGIYAFAKSSAAPSGSATARLRAAVADAVRTVEAAAAVDGGERPVIDVQDFDEVEVRMERGLLDIVLSNLLANATKFTAGASVRLVTVRAHRGADSVHVEVEDTGPGVPDRLNESVFEAYKCPPDARATGLGLGLATVKRLVLAHGGNVGVRKSLSGGAVFWFELPVAARRAPAAAAALPARALRPAKL